MADINMDFALALTSDLVSMLTEDEFIQIHRCITDAKRLGIFVAGVYEDENEWSSIQATRAQKDVFLTFVKKYAKEVKEHVTVVKEGIFTEEEEAELRTIVNLIHEKDND